MKIPNLKLVTSFRLFCSAKVFGPGMAELLELVEDTGSLRQASVKMNLAYSKAWKMLTTAEAALGYQLLNRNSGGMGGGGSSLTEEGRELLYSYRHFEAEALKEVNIVFTKYFN